MKNCWDYCQELFWDEQGAAAVEYAILLSCIAVAIAATLSWFGGTVQHMYQEAVDKLK